MSPLDQVIAELEAEKQHLELTITFLRGRRSLALATAPQPPRLVPPATPAPADPAVGEAFTAAQQALAPARIPVPARQAKPKPAAAPRRGALKKSPAKPATAAPAKTAPAPKGAAAPQSSLVTERVLACLSSVGAKAQDIARDLKLPTPRVRYALRVLKERRLARTEGKTYSAVWIRVGAAPAKATPSGAAPAAARPPLRTLPQPAPVSAAPPRQAGPAIVSDGVELVTVYSAAMERSGERKLSEVRP